MALDGITVANIVNELNTALSGARINKITQPEPDEIMLTVRTPDGPRRLLMSASASLPLIYFTEKNKLSPMTAPNFCMLLRKHIGSGKILRVWQPSLERIIHFEIEHYDEMGDLRRKDLILELMGKYSNLIFCNEEGMILDSIKHISAQTSSVREVLPGRPYFIPQTQEKYDPLNLSENEFLESVFSKPLPLSKALYTSYTGISPVIAEELCFRASIESDQSAREIPESAKLHLLRIFSELMEDIKAGSFEPNILYDESGIPVEFASVPLTMYSDYRCVGYSSVSALLEDYYAQRNAANRIRQKSADLRHIVNTILERESRKLDLQHRQLKDTEKREKFRIYGELLHTYGYSAKPGDKFIMVPNYYDDNKEIRIPLDENKSASENAKRFFKKYEKQKRTFEALTDYIRRHAADGRGSGRKGASRPEKSRPYHYQTEDGYDIYVGKNNIQNDELTFRFANAGDWWFHAKKMPGSHVIVKRTSEDALPDHIFEVAASAAAYYSAGRNADKVEIDYVQRREVKKPNGAKPGFVVYYTNYSMVAKPDISALTLV